MSYDPALWIFVGAAITAIAGTWFVVFGLTIKRLGQKGSFVQASLAIIGFSFGVILTVYGISSLNVVDEEYKLVNQTARELFQGISSNTPVNQNVVANGQIAFKNLNTAVVTSTVVSAESNSSLPLESSFLIPLTSTNLDMKLSGNLSKDNKKWCFYIYTPSYQVIYNQSGRVKDGYGSAIGYCLNGLAYDASDASLDN